MATFTSVPQTTSSQFKHYDPTLLKRAKPRAKVTGNTTPTNHTVEATYNLGLLHQGIVSATNGLLNGSSQDFHPIDTVEERDSAAHVQPSNKISDHQENNYDLTAGNEEDQVSQHVDLDATIKHTFSVGYMESPCHEGSPAEDGTFFGTIDVTNRPPATSERSRHSSVIGAITITPAAATDVVLEPAPEDAYPAKRQRLVERQQQSPMLEPVSTPKSTSLLNLSGQASRSIPSPQIAGRKDDGATNLVLAPSDLRDEEDDHDADFQGTIDELLQSRRSISSFGWMEGEQDVSRDTDWHEMNQPDSLEKVRESFEDKLSHNKEGFGIPPAKPRQRVGRDRVPSRKRGLSNTALRPLYYNEVPMRAQQKARPSQPRQNPMPGRPRIDRGLRSCSPQSLSPGTTARDGTNINYRSNPDMSYEITDFTICAIPNGSSIVAATLCSRDSYPSLDPAALGHKFFGKQGRVIRMTQLSSDSWLLLGYRCNDTALDLCNRGSLNAEWMSSSHSDAASYGTDHSEDDWDGEGEDGDQGAKVYSRRKHNQWLESEKQLLLSLRDKQGMGWNDVCERFPGRSMGAVKVRYHMLKKAR